MNLNQVKPGASIWLYVVEPMEECFPIAEKEYVLTEKYLGGNGTWFKVKSVASEKEENRVINNFDYGVSAHSGNKIYIWLSEKDFRRAFEIVKQYYMGKLVKATNEVSRLATIFANMEGWIDCMSCMPTAYSDDNPIEVVKNASFVDLTEETEEVND